jgi:uncharacterized protein
MRVTPLDPKHLTLLRLRFAIGAVAALPFLVWLDVTLAERGLIRPWLVAGAGAVLLLLLVVTSPGRRYRAWAYTLGEDELAVRHGLMIRKLTIVPFGRVQHIDVAQGPLQRMLGLATLVLNTAGTRGAAVKLPGLLPREAEAMREHVRGKIRQDLM